MTFNTRTTYTQKTVRLAIRLWGAADQCTMSQVPISIPWHREYWNIQLKAIWEIKPQISYLQPGCALVYTNQSDPVNFVLLLRLSIHFKTMYLIFFKKHSKLRQYGITWTLDKITSVHHNTLCRLAQRIDQTLIVFNIDSMCISSQAYISLWTVHTCISLSPNHTPHK